MNHSRILVGVAGVLLLVAAGGLIAVAAALLSGLGHDQGIVAMEGKWDAVLLTAAAIVTAAAGLALFLGGGALRSSALSLVAIAAEAAIFERWTEATPGAAAVAHALGLLLAPALFSLSTAGDPSLRAVRTAAWSLFGVGVVVVILFRSPPLDALCRGSCAPSPLAIATVSEVVLLVRWVLAAAAIALAVVAVLSWARRTPRRLATVTALVALGAAAIAVASAAAWAVGGPLPPTALALVVPVLLLLVGATQVVDALVVARRRAAVQALAGHSSGDSDDTIVDELLAAFGAPSALAAFPLADGLLVDAHGLDVRTDATRTTILSGDEVAAVLLSERPLDDQIAAQIGPAVGLTLANVRDRARERAATRELEESRRRVVEAGDAIRRAIERDLHDGAQQALLALQYELAVAGGTPGVAPDRAEVGDLAARLRAISHGTFPMALDDIGLDAALNRLADDAASVVKVSVDLDVPPPRTVARTAYLAVADAVRAADRGVTVVDVTSGDGVLIIKVVGAPPTSSTRDRIDALGGAVELDADRTKVVLPCALS